MVEISDIIEGSLNLVIKGSVIIGLITGAIAFAAYVYQDKIMYIPDPSPSTPKLTKNNPTRYRAPSEYSITGEYISRRHGGFPIPYEESFVETPDGERIHVWLMHHGARSHKFPTLIYFHGNAANMGYRLPNAAKMYGVSELNILMMDYRGFGESSGVPSERGINIDADAVLRFAQKHPLLQRSPIVLFGRSLGGAVAVSLCDRSPEHISALVLENTFISIPSMVDALMPWAASLKHLVLRIHWDNGKKIRKITKPIYFISGELDEIVPASHMRVLYEVSTASALKDFFQVIGGHHNDAWEVAGIDYYYRLKDFLSRAIPTPESPEGEEEKEEQLEEEEPKAESTGDAAPAESTGEAIESSPTEESGLEEDEFYSVTHADVVDAGGSIQAIPSMRDSALHRSLME